MRGKAWLLLLAVIPFALTTWAAFVYSGIRARRPRWLAWAAVYAAMLVAYLVIDATAQHNNAAAAVAAAIGLLAWIGGGAHAFAISDDAVRQIHDRTDPALDAARMRIERRAEGRKLLAKQPVLAKEIGLGRPDIPGADDYGVVRHSAPTQGILDDVIPAENGPRWSEGWAGSSWSPSLAPAIGGRNAKRRLTPRPAA